VLAVLPSSVPAITFQPLSKVVCPGTDLIFHVVATGQDLQYSWFFQSNQLPDTTPVLTVTDVTTNSSGDYYCVVSTAGCTSQPSEVATLTVASSCNPNFTTIIFTIGGQTPQSFNSSFRDNVFLPGIVKIVLALGIFITQNDIVIVSVTQSKSGSAVVEFGITGANGTAALQALLNLWATENTGLLTANGLGTVTSIQSGSAIVIIPNPPQTTSTSGGDGGSDTGAIVGGVVGGLLGFAVLVMCVVLIVLLVVFLVKKGGISKLSGGRWSQQNWWEEDDL